MTGAEVETPRRWGTGRSSSARCWISGFDANRSVASERGCAESSRNDLGPLRLVCDTAAIRYESNLGKNIFTRLGWC